MKRTTAVLIVLWLILLLGSNRAAAKLRDLIPSLYGGDGIQLVDVAGHGPHFSFDTQNSFNQLNNQIASEVAIFPFTSSSGGFTYTFDPARGTFVRTTETLGPLFAERASTLGRGKFSLNFAYTFYQFDRFEGNDVHSLQVTTRHQPDVIGDPNQRELFELDSILVTLDADIRVKLYTFAVTYGITNDLDVGILFPIVHVAMDIKSNARVIVSPQNPTPNLHTFGGPDSPVDSKSGDATGIGDIVLRAKYHLYKGPIADIAGALLLKLPSGDEDNFLGTGTTTLRPFLIVSRTFFDVFTPHLNLGYEIDFNRSKQDALNYVLGFEVGIEKFSALVDLLGRYKPNGNGIGDNTLTGSFGGKWNPFKQFVMFLNFQVPLNDQGLRSNVITTVGAEYTF